MDAYVHINYFTIKSISQYVPSFFYFFKNLIFTSWTHLVYRLINQNAVSNYYLEPDESYQ